MVRWALVAVVLHVLLEVEKGLEVELGEDHCHQRAALASSLFDYDVDPLGSQGGGVSGVEDRCQR